MEQRICVRKRIAHEVCLVVRSVRTRSNAFVLRHFGFKKPEENMYLECLLVAFFLLGALVGSFATWLLSLPPPPPVVQRVVPGSPGLGPVLAPTAFAALTG